MQDFNDEEMAVEWFLDLKECDIGTAASIFEKMSESFQEHCIPWENITGFASDYASLMKGVNNSVLTELKEKQPNIIYNVGCPCHLIHTVINKAAKMLAVDIKETVTRVYVTPFERC